MADRLSNSFAYRSLLTDTLPYEVPVIFSNDRFHAGLSAPPQGPVEEFWKKLLDGRHHYTIPYSYSVAKDNRRSTTLSIVHPLAQKDIAEFYETHYGGMLSHCNRGKFSLRKPIALSSPFYRDLIADEERDKSGIPQLLAEAGEADMSHLSSYFTYGKYNLLAKFIGSREYIRLEKRYSMMRQIDVSKCFYNIYTHSVTWAVKSKSFAKEQRDTYSFEAKFDKLMQKCNHNETNGIVVGPEFSRIFSEIILQDIDECLESDLKENGMHAGLHYDVRRYIDDYFIFSGDSASLDRVESCLRGHLERYKLYVNENKVATFARPFVSALSLAKDEIAAKLREISVSFAEMTPDMDIEVLSRIGRSVRAKLNSIRLSVARYEIQFANISGWLMSRLKRVIRRVVGSMPEYNDLRSREALGDVAIASFELALYICSIDLRVRTTYTICQFALLFQRSEDTFTTDQNDLVAHLLCENAVELIRFRMIERGTDFGVGDDIEICNILICGAHFVGEDFLLSSIVQKAFDTMISVPKMTYFNYISLVFCLRKSILMFGDRLKTVNEKARNRVLNSDINIFRDTEEYLFAVDYISSPDVSGPDKQSFVSLLFNQRNLVSFKTLEVMADHLGFADWSGVTVEHQLRRKELRPVYAWV